MADNKKYYYMRLTEDFLDSEAMVALESLPDGYIYSNILLKMYAKSLRGEGRLMLNDRIPYNPGILAKVTRHNVRAIKKALDVFLDLGLIEILDSGAIYMLDIQNFIGTSSTWADRKREYRARIESERDTGASEEEDTTRMDKCPDKSPECVDKCLGECADKSLPESRVYSLYTSSSQVSDSDAGVPPAEEEKKKALPHDSNAYKAASYLDRRICVNVPSKKPSDERTLQRWAADIDKINRLDGQSWDDISDVLAFCQSDSFWSTNILSGKKLREKFIQLLAKVRAQNAG